MRRQLLPVFIDQIRDELQDLESVSMPESVEQKIDQYAVESDVFDQAFEQLDEMTRLRRATDIEDDKSDVFLRSAMISRVEIQNFHCLDSISFEFGRGMGNRVGWKVLLGENGAGKSSILKAVALAVMGRNRIKDVLKDIDPLNILKRGEDQGYVKVYFSTETQPIELVITPKGLEYSATESTLRTYMLGFGSARWLPRPGSQEPEKSQSVRIRNLFNPFVPLTNAVQWLADFAVAC